MVGDLEFLRALREWEVGVGRLQQLHTLLLDHNRIKHLPPQIDRLTGLKKLTLDHNQVRKEEATRSRQQQTL